MLNRTNHQHGRPLGPKLSAVSRSKALAAGSSTVWSTNDASKYSALYDEEPSSSLRKVTKPTGQQSLNNQSKGIKRKDLGYAFIGKEADQYLQEDLREELNPSLFPLLSVEPIAPSPQAPAKVTPRMVADEYKRAGHFDTTVKQLLSSFQTSTYKDELLQSLEKLMVQRLSQMDPEARQKMASQDPRLQHSDMEKWLEESVEVAETFDDLFAKMRGRENDESSMFNKEGSVGKGLESKLEEILQSEKRRMERKGDSSDEEGGGSTPMVKGGSATPAQDISSRGSQTPMTTSIPETSVSIDTSQRIENEGQAQDTSGGGAATLPS